MKTTRIKIFEKSSLMLTMGILVILIFGFGVRSEAAYNHVELTSADLPYTARSNDSITVAGTKITSATYGIVFNGVHDVIVDMGTDTLEFANNYGDGYYAMRFAGGSYDIEINGGYIIAGSGTGGSDSAWSNTAVTFGSSTQHDILFKGVTIVMQGWNTRSFYANGAWYNIELDDCRIYNDGAGFTDRCAQNGAAMIMAATNKHAYQLIIHDTYIHSHGAAISTSGISHIYNCSLIVDTRNDYYTYPSGNMCWGTANSNGIGLGSSTYPNMAGTKLHNNVILAGTEYWGCDIGIGIAHCQGKPDSMIEIYDNKIVLNKGYDPAYGSLTAKCFKERWQNRYIWYHGNEFYAFAHSDSTDAFGSYCEGAELTNTDSDHGSEGVGLDSFVIIENNRFVCYALNDGATGAGGRFSSRGEFSNPPYSWREAGNIIRNNYWEGNSRGLVIGKADGGTARGLLFEGDTIAAYNPADGYVTYEIGLGGSAAKNNIMRDIVYLGEASESNIRWWYTGSEIAFERTLKIYVKGSNGSPVQGATVVVTNSYGQTVIDTTTDAFGYAYAIARYKRDYYDSPDSTGYNPFTIIANMGGDSTVITSFVVGHDTESPTIILSETAGLPPEVTDLTVSNVSGNSVTLAWTSPGTAGDDSMALEYDVRYSTQNITYDNWDQATQAVGEPVPKVFGNPETFSISGLGDQTYYFCMKARYGLDNWSRLSNVATNDTTAPERIEDLGAATGTRDGEIYLSWSPSGDDGMEGSAVSYAIRYSDNNFSAADWDQISIYNDYYIPNSPETRISLTMSDPDIIPGTEYFIAVKARDDAGNLSSISNIADAISGYEFSLEEVETTIDLIYPGNHDDVSSSQPTFKIHNLEGLENVVYTFEIARDSGFTDLVAGGSVEQDDGDMTIWHAPVSLDPMSEYCWHVSASTYDTSSTYFFTVVPETHAYPNPFDIMDAGSVTFTELPENSNLILMTVSGTTVMKWDNISGGQITWDGTNESGHLVASATYLWYVENTDINGKIVVIR